jgi:hypothetical protein
MARTLPGARIHGDEAAFDLGQLRDRPLALGAADQANDGAGADLRLRVRFGCESRGRRLQAVADDRHRLAVLQHGDHLLGRRLGDDGRAQLVVVGEVLQRFGDASVELAAIGRQVDVVLGAAIDLPLLVIHDAPAKGVIGERLLGRVERQIDVEPARVGLGAVLVEDHLARLLGDVLGMHRDFRGRAVLQDLLQRGIALRRR